mgnify:CR=1 FL=1
MKSLLRLRPYLRRYWLTVSLSLLTLLLLTGAQLLVPQIIRQIIDVGLAEKNLRYLLLSALVLLGIGLLRSVLTYTLRYLNEWVASHIGYDLRNELYDHIQNLPFSFHDHSQTGQLISRCIEDVRAIERFAGFSVVEIIRLLLLVSGVVAVLFNAQPRLAVIALLPMIPMVLVTTNYGKRVGKY